jgi:outer membrane protein assembly factor BamB
MGEACEYMPPVEAFETTEEWSWPVGAAPVAMPSHNQVMMAPMVANLTDDDGDGAIDQNDVPDVVFHTFTGSNYWADGILRAIRGNDGTEIWPTGDPGYRTSPGGEVAIAELDGASAGPEILVCSPSNYATATPGHLMLVSAAGALLRRFDTPPNDVPCGYDAPAVADMNRDGVPEIVVRHVIAHADGTVLRRIRDDRASGSAYNTLADVDGDMDLELVSANGVYRYDGTPLWERTVDMPSRPAIPLGNIAIADLDLDTTPEIVVVAAGNHAIYALDAASGDTVWGPIDVNPPEIAAEVLADGNPTGGGPPTIANFDTDPNPEIAFAGGFAYVIFEHDGSRAWYFVTRDRSSRGTGSSIFDFEGDGLAEVLYNDELFMRVFRGTDGMVLYDRCNASGTLREYPIVVDVDNDDHAEIVLMENNYAFTCLDGTPARTGIHAFGHPRNEWVRTRRIWNQHTYHVTNIEEDGTVPRMESPNWTVPRLNNFRQNVQPDGLFDAPDLVLVDLYASTDACPTELRLSVRVLNRGAAGAPPGIPVTFYDVTSGTRVSLGRERTTRPLLPGESELVVLATPYAIPAGREADIFSFEAVVNDPTDMPEPTLHECREDNNTTGAVEISCPLIM